METHKTCSKCGESKWITDFYTQPNSSDGFFGSCKECVKAAARKNRAENLDRARAYDVARAKTKKRIEHGTRVTRSWREKYPERYQANTALNNALRDGRLVKQPCEICGAKYVHAHHDDYSKPLEVRWLCPVHHKEHHGHLTLHHA